jgi:chromate transporter
MALGAIGRVFLKLGATAFGGPAVHIAMMEGEVVTRRRWLTRAEFLDLLGAAHLIPGPNSTELALHVGYRRAGWRGLLVAGLAFILPAAIIATLAAWLYTRFGRAAGATAVLYGIKPVAVAVIGQAIWVLARAAIKTRGLALLGALALGASLAGVHELVVLAAAVLIAMIGGRAHTTPGAASVAVLASNAGLSAAVSAATGATASTFALVPLFLTLAKIGAVLFGSGYVLVAFLRADLVERLGWLTEAQLLDAVAIGQLIPGPVFTTATFIGFVLGGLSGAAVATLGIFLPAFVFVAASGPLVPALRRSPVAARVLDAVNVASLALMVAVLVWMSGTALVDPLTVFLMLASLVALIRYRVQAAWLLLGGALLGWVAVMTGGQGQ